MVGNSDGLRQGRCLRGGCEKETRCANGDHVAGASADEVTGRNFQPRTAANTRGEIGTKQLE